MYDCLGWCIRDELPDLSNERMECFKEHAPNVNYSECLNGCAFFKDTAKCAKCRGIAKCPLLYGPCPPGVTNSHPTKHPIRGDTAY